MTPIRDIRRLIALSKMLRMSGYEPSDEEIRIASNEVWRKDLHATLLPLIYLEENWIREMWAHSRFADQNISPYKMTVFWFYIDIAEAQIRLESQA